MQRLDTFESFSCFLMGYCLPFIRLIMVFSRKISNFYNKILRKNVHQVCGAGIWTHDLLKASLLP